MCEIVLSQKLTAALNEEGVEEKYFKPVYTKRKKVIGYVFTTENILPQGVYKDSNYQVERICEVCGNVSLKENVEKCLVETKFINMKNVTDFQNVNYTHEFYEGHRQIIISAKVQKIIKKYVKEASFIPIYGV